MEVQAEQDYDTRSSIGIDKEHERIYALYNQILTTNFNENE